MSGIGIRLVLFSVNSGAALASPSATPPAPPLSFFLGPEPFWPRIAFPLPPSGAAGLESWAEDSEKETA